MTGIAMGACIPPLGVAALGFLTSACSLTSPLKAQSFPCVFDHADLKLHRLVAFLLCSFLSSY
uniref:Secreted protein n=1 Tax=Rhizophora mucronata TaxID=61149 RepID=A0A2P2J211_RHIMU